MNLNKSIPVVFGHVHGRIFGGPFRQYQQGTRRLVGVKMAAEINHPHEISIPTVDFSVPDPKEMERGLLKAVEALYAGNDIYAGCMAGIGRTGLFMGCMAACLQEFERQTLPAGQEVLGIDDPVLWVRRNYSSHAMETDEQKRYAREFPTEVVVERLVQLTAPKVVETEVIKTEVVVQYPTLWQWLKRKFSFDKR